MRFFKPVCTSFVLLLLFCFAQCKKDSTRLHNITLTGKSLGEIRATIRGDWFVVRRTICGVAGCGTLYNDIATADIMSFLPNDTLKQTAHNGTPIYRYEKADSIKFIPSYYTNQSAWTFYFSTPLTFINIQNDTLTAEMGYGEIGLLRKP